MANKFRVTDCDIIYLSYDEPNAEKNYSDLCQKVPWAKRVHGVKGSDSAHKACAEISETDRFITVDGDNIIDPEFLNQELDFTDHADLEHNVISWCGRNVVNSLMYGNGGVKCWPKNYVLNMRTHENADPNNLHAQVDFCWDAKYIQMNSCYSTIYNNATPQQAWRAGFREGVKLVLDRGVRLEKTNFLQNAHWKNLHMLYVWCMVGADVENGLWAIYGARKGLFLTMCTDWDYVQVRDFDYLNDYWEKTTKTIAEKNLMEEIHKLGELLKCNLNLSIAKNPLDGEQNKFFKSLYQNPKRNHRLKQLIIDPE